MSRILFAFLIVATLMFTGCQNNSGKTKSRISTSARQLRYNKSGSPATNGDANTNGQPAATGEGTDQADLDLAATNKVHCKRGIEFSDICRAIYVVVNEDNTMSGLDKPLLINQNKGLVIDPSKVRPKEGTNKVDFTANASEALRKNARALLLVVLSEANFSIKEQINSVSLARTLVETIEVKNNDLTQLLERVGKAEADQQVVTIAVGRSLHTLVKGRLGGLLGNPNSRVTLHSFRETQISTVGIESILLKKYVGDLLYLAFILPYTNDEINLDTLRVKIDGRELKVGTKNLADDDDVRIGAEDGKVLVKIVNRNAFKKFNDPVNISFEMAN